MIPANSVSLDQLDQQLERSIENVRQIQIIVSDFQQQGQPGLNQKLQNIVKDLQEIDKIKPSLQDIQVRYNWVICEKFIFILACSESSLGYNTFMPLFYHICSDSVISVLYATITKDNLVSYFIVLNVAD